MNGETCVWTYSPHDYSWEGTCGAKWSFIEGGPKENEQNFCPKCGKPCEAIEWKEDE